MSICSSYTGMTPTAPWPTPANLSPSLGPQVSSPASPACNTFAPVHLDSSAVTQVDASTKDLNANPATTGSDPAASAQVTRAQSETGRRITGATSTGQQTGSVGQSHDSGSTPAGGSVAEEGARAKGMTGKSVRKDVGKVIDRAGDGASKVGDTKTVIDLVDKLAKKEGGEEVVKEGAKEGAEEVVKVGVKEGLKEGAEEGAKIAGEEVPGAGAVIAGICVVADAKSVYEDAKSGNDTGAVIDSVHAITDALGALPEVGGLISLAGDGLAAGLHYLTGH